MFFKNATAFESKHDRVLKKHGQCSPKYSKTLSGKDPLTEKEYDDSLIKKAKIIFRPGTILAGALETLKYSKVPIKYIKEEKEESNEGLEE